jgi:hypothetical protein
MTLEERVQSALRTSEPALRALVRDLAREGHAKSEIIELLERVVLQQRTGGEVREEDEEALLDLLDALRGWCHPTAELLPEKPAR